MTTTVEDLPKHVQYITVDSDFVDGSNNNFSLNLGLESNIHLRHLNQVIGCKLVEMYVTQIGQADSNLNTDVAKYIDVHCDEIPKNAQLLNERSGHILARIPLERHFTGANNVIRDKQWKPFQRQNVLFNPIPLKKLSFRLYEYQDDGDYVPLNPLVKWHFVLEITCVDAKKPPKDKDLKMLQAINNLSRKIDRLNTQLVRVPEVKEEEKAVKSRRFTYLMLFIVAVFGGVIFYVNKSGPTPPSM